MDVLIGDPVTRLLVFDAYSAWRATEGKEKSPISAGLFAFEVTDFGALLFEGLNEAQVCELLGGEPFSQR